MVQVKALSVVQRFSDFGPKKAKKIGRQFPSGD
jgi:hypothetical protein